MQKADKNTKMYLHQLSINSDIESSLPVVSNRESDFKLGKKLEVLLLCLLGEASSYQQHLRGRHHHRKSVSSTTHETTQTANTYVLMKSKLTLRCSAWMTPFLATEREDLRCMILSRHSDSHTGHRK